jgi:Fur family transcriptional regulator, ferric uptake regulator
VRPGPDDPYTPLVTPKTPAKTTAKTTAKATSRTTAKSTAKGPDVHETAGSRLRLLGQQYTPTRRAIVEVLRRAADPVSIPDIMKAKPSLALSSVYRTLAVLEQANIAHRLVTSNEFSRYELAEELTSHHHHLICTSCGRMKDFTLSTKVERSAEKSLEQIAEEAGFLMHGHRLDVVGLCADCA